MAWRVDEGALMWRACVQVLADHLLSRVQPLCMGTESQVPVKIFQQLLDQPDACGMRSACARMGRGSRAARSLVSVSMQVFLARWDEHLSKLKSAQRKELPNGASNSTVLVRTPMRGRLV
jgi:hypothetical protein